MKAMPILDPTVQEKCDNQCCFYMEIQSISKRFMEVLKMVFEKKNDARHYRRWFKGFNVCKYLFL